MEVLFVNVGLLRTVQWKGKPVLTRILKASLSGRIGLRTRNFDGDAQADLSAHGWPDKVVCAYPVEHYGYWRRELPDMTPPWGIFDGNLTTEGMPDDTLKLGARLRIGATEVVVTQPQLPCYKLALRIGRDGSNKPLLASARQSVDFKVVTEDDVAAGDPIAVIDWAEDSVPR